MARKWHNHRLQTNPPHCVEEKQNTNSHMTSRGNSSKTNSSLFPSDMIAKLETTLSTPQQYKDKTHKTHKTMGATIKNE